MTRAVLDSLTQLPDSDGRGFGGHDTIARCRNSLATFFGIGNPKQICFAASGTDALNTAIIGSLSDGDEVICTVFDHNSVTRPLCYLKLHRRVVVRQISTMRDGSINLEQLRESLNANTRAIIITHISNVTGAVTSLEEIAELIAVRRITLIIDASQSVGVVPIDLSALPTRTILTAAAHKGLYAPSGTGILVVPDELVGQRLHGGTGIRSETPHQPTELPHRHEAGTPNHTGIAGLYAGIGFVEAEGVAKLSAHRSRLVHMTRERLSALDGVELTPLPQNDGRGGIVGFRLRGMTSEEVGFALESAFSIQVRTGLHCAPTIHRALGTFPDGLVRVSFGAFNLDEDAESLVEAVAQINSSKFKGS